MRAWKDSGREWAFWVFEKESRRISVEVCMGTHLKFSIQSIPLGSASENTKQENEARNCSPHVPCAIPPRQGQSQLISPVSSLKAPCCEASSSVSSKDSESGSVLIGTEFSDDERLLDWRAAAIDSRVCIEVSSLGEEGGSGTAAKD